VSTPPDAVPVVQLTGIRKRFNEGLPTETEVLHGIDLVVRPGEFTSLIGPSGSGKSTLLNVLGLLDRPSGGNYLLKGEAIGSASDDTRTRARLGTLGFVFQFHHLLPAFSALENVMLPGLMRDGAFTDANRANARSLLASVGLADAMDKRPSELSGGMQQRVAIARALALAPDLVLADEPTGNLDTQSADDAFALLRRFNEERGCAFMIVTHDPRLAARCDRVVELRDGTIVRDEATPAPASKASPVAGPPPLVSG